MLRKYAAVGRDAAFATELASRDRTPQGTLRRRAGRVHRPPAGQGRRPRCSTRCAWAPTSCSPCGCPPTPRSARRVDLVRGRGRSGAGRLRQRRAAHGSPSTTSTTWLARSHPTATRTPPATSRSRTPTRAGWSRSWLERSATDELEALLAADNERPAGDAGGPPGPGDRGRAAGGSRPAGRRTAWCWRAATPGVPAVAEGRAGVQDEGSQLVAAGPGRRAVEGRDERWLDLCAGPGGKAALLAALAAERGAGVVANERQPHRAGLVRRGAARRRRASLRRRRRRRHPAARGPPGRSTGCWSTRRAPGSARCAGGRRRAGGVSRRTSTTLVPLQRALLGARSTGPAWWRGRSTRPARRCWPRRRRGRGGARRRADDASLVRCCGRCCPAYPTAPAPLPGTVQLWPHRHGTDAMFGALLRRVEP